jgi:hypothetical protein
VGDLVKVEGWILDDGTWLAEEIKPVDDEPPTFEFTGPIESIDPWAVAGIAFEVRPWTEIDAGLEIGEQVKVEGRIMEDGTWVAFEVKRVEDSLTPRIVFVGRVDSMAPWIVSGISLPVDEETAIGDGILVGVLVRVEIALLPDGTWKVLSIHPLQTFQWGAGCLTFTGVVVSFGEGQLQLVGWPVLILDDDLEIDEDIVPNSIVLIQLCFAEDGTLHISYIIVIYVPGPVIVEPPAPPAPGEGEGKVPLCHKPDEKKGGQTITVSESAVPAHLGHGDTLGACP